MSFSISRSFSLVLIAPFYHVIEKDWDIFWWIQNWEWFSPNHVWFLAFYILSFRFIIHGLVVVSSLFDHELVLSTRICCVSGVCRPSFFLPGRGRAPSGLRTVSFGIRAGSTGCSWKSVFPFVNQCHRRKFVFLHSLRQSKGVLSSVHRSMFLHHSDVLTSTKEILHWDVETPRRLGKL